MHYRCYILGLTNLERIFFQNMPEGITPSRTANYAEILVVARNNPLQHYITGSDTLALELDFYSEEENRKDVLAKVNWLKSLTRSQGLKKAPEKIKVVFGELFKDENWIVNSVIPKLSMFSQTNGYLPQQANVTLNLTLDTDRNIFAEDII